MSARSPSRRPPGPRPHFPFGNFPLGHADPLATFSRWARDFGDIFYYRAGWLEVYFLNHPRFVESVLVDQHQNFRKDRVVRNTRWIFGDGLLTSEGPSWLRQRRIIQPAFHRERIASYVEAMTGYAEEMLGEWRDGETRDVHREMMGLTLRIVAKVLFGLEVKGESEKIAAALNVLIGQGSGGKMVLPPILRYLPVPAMVRVRRAARELDEVAYEIIRQRRNNGHASGDMLAMLMQAQDADGSRMSDQQLRDEAITFLLAGHETTALALSWAWYLLSQNPDVEKRLHAELEQVLQGRAPTAQDLPCLPYAERVMKEAMRLYPPGWAIARTVIREFEIGGYRVPANANVVMSQWVMHRDGRFFAEPEKFDPDRWLPERAQTVPKYAYFPFGAGPRGCIGSSFAMMEAMVLLATIGQRFQLRVVPEQAIVPMPSVTLRPKYGIRVMIQRRGSSH
jgi:cytochrome P450